MPYRFLVTLIILTANVAAYASDAHVLVTEVKDSRSTGQFFNELEIKLRLVGDDVAGAKGVRTIIATAVDESGRSLVKGGETKQEFKLLQDPAVRPDVDLKFLNPARRATVIKEITGEVQLFMPARDKSATVIIKDVTNRRDQAVKDAGLDKAGVKLTILSKRGYEALTEQKEQKAAQEAEKSLGQAMVQALKGMVGAFFQVGENDLILQVADPEEKFVSAEVVDAKGAAIPTISTTSAEELRVLGFDRPLPPDAQLRIYLKTPKSLEIVPVKLSDVALP